MPYGLIPYFTVDSMYITYPDRQTVDDHNAMDAYRRQEICLARGIHQENPFMIAARALNLSAKYSIPIGNAGPLLDDLSERMDRWRPPHPFHLEAQRLAAADTLHAIVRSADQREFVDAVLGTSVLKHLIPEATKALAALRDGDRGPWNYASDAELTNTLQALMEGQRRRAFLLRVGGTALTG